MRHQLIIGSLVLLLAALPLAGCGDNDNNDNSGSGGSCGNGFIDQSSESCDGSDFDGETCQTLGFASGSLQCTSKCQFDTSSCEGSSSRTPTPVVTATPGTGPTATTADATATPGGAPTPTVTATPSGSACGAGQSIVVVASLAGGDYTSAIINLKYPTSANIPGSGTETSVSDRVVFEGDGLKVRNDVDSDDDLVDDTLTAGLAGTDVATAGPFVTVTFDCVEGQPEPAAGEFTCIVQSASLSGNPATLTCNLAIQ